MNKKDLKEEITALKLHLDKYQDSLSEKGMQRIFEVILIRENRLKDYQNE